MELNTASAVMSFSRKLEEEGAATYEKLAKQFEQGAEIFKTLAAENKRTIIQVERAYYGVISDALDGTFAFKMNTSDFAFSPDISSADFATALKQVIANEKNVAAFYSKAGEQSKSLLSDVSRAFLLAARKRQDRILKLKTL